MQSEITEAEIAKAAERLGVAGRAVCVHASLRSFPRLHALLLQLVTNLVHNAIVHNLPAHGAVWVTTSVHPNGGVMLRVENTGEPLTAQSVATLIEPFLRGSDRIRADHAGVGLGLAIVNTITEAHDGTLTLTPRAEGGLCASVQLPSCRSHAV